MKKKYFYSHLIETSEISLSIGEMDMPAEDRVKLLSFAEENLHHNILDAILSELSEEDKKTFLSHVTLDNHGNTWQFLKEKISDVDEKIIDLALKFKKSLQDDIEESKK